MDTWSLILSLIGSFGLGTLLTTIVDRILNYSLQKKKFQFEKLYIKRAEVIEENYRKMVKMYRAFESLMAPLQLAGEPSRKEKLKIAVDRANELIEEIEELEGKLKNMQERVKQSTNEWKEADKRRYKAEGKLEESEEKVEETEESVEEAEDKEIETGE